MLQPGNLEIQATYDWVPVHFVPAQSQQEGRISGNLSRAKAAASLRNSIPDGISPNKRAVMDRLITLWAEGSLG